MKNFVLAGLVAAPMTVVAQPAAAANFEQGASVQTGTFAGARVRISLGGNQPDRKFRAGLTLAPTLRSQSISGETRMRIGEGLELGFNGKRPLALSLAGRPVDRLLPNADKKLGLSTGGKVALGVGAAALIGVGVYFAAAIHCNELKDECGE